MKKGSGLLLFSVLLIALTTFCKYKFGADANWSGFSPVIAIALFAGFMIKDKKIAFLIPLLSLIVSDAIIHWLYVQGVYDFAGFYGGQWKNYLLLLTATLVGFLLRGKKAVAIAAGSVLAPAFYFLSSNFYVWAASGMYTKDFSGLMTCYTAALPFYRNSLIATIVFLPLIMLAYNYLTAKKARLALA